MHPSGAVQLLAVLAVLAAGVGARRCHVSHPPVEVGGPWTTVYEACPAGLDFCFRGRVTAEGEAAVRELFQWPVNRGQLLQACVEGLDPPLEEMWGWYDFKSIRVCRTDACNS